MKLESDSVIEWGWRHYASKNLTLFPDCHYIGTWDQFLGKTQNPDLKIVEMGINNEGMQKPLKDYNQLTRPQKIQCFKTYEVLPQATDLVDKGLDTSTTRLHR